jgi:release factor glutamine methyltransferase
MTTAREAWTRGAERLAVAGIDSAKLDARVLLAHVMGAENAALMRDRAPKPEELVLYEELLARRSASEPVAYITGVREFWSLEFAVGPGALVPRPDTETLVEEACKAFPARDGALEVLDLGTGSGCLLIAFLSERPKAQGTGVDFSPDALTWARDNAEALGVAARTRWVEGDWSAVAARYDVIFSNPPYLRLDEAAFLAPDVALYEPPGALFAGKDGLDAYRALGPVIAGGLKPTGRAFLEIGAGQQERVCEVLVTHGLEILGITPDLSGIPRCVSVARAAGVSGPRAEKTVGNQRASR